MSIPDSLAGNVKFREKFNIKNCADFAIKVLISLNGAEWMHGRPTMRRLLMEVICAWLDVVVSMFVQKHLWISSGPRRSKLTFTPAVRPEIYVLMLISGVNPTYQD